MSNDPKPAPADEDQITDLDTGGGGADEGTADEDVDKGDKADLGDE